METLWQAKWIWHPGEASPRNDWSCFRKTFAWPDEENGRRVSLKLTADSRYVLYVNGHRVGQGPPRSWPFRLAYDEYEISHLLKPGQTNAIAVMVMHFGISNFYYLRGRGGLLAQLEVESNSPLQGEGQPYVMAVTDDTWLTVTHPGHDRRSPRMSCQHAFAEKIDARLWDEAWTESDYKPGSEWHAAAVIGPVGCEPWGIPVSRDIPYLTEEPVYPRRVERLGKVKPVQFTAAIDLRNHFYAESTNTANPAEFLGMLATVVRCKQHCKATLALIDVGGTFRGCSLDGVHYDESSLTGEAPERFIHFDLEPGDHFLLIDVSGGTHGGGYHFAMDAEETLEFLSPLMFLPAGNLTQEDDKTAFVTLGPFDGGIRYDHLPSPPMDEGHPDYLRAKEISDVAGLLPFASWVRSVPEALVSREDVFILSVWKRHEVPLSIPGTLQNAVIPGPEPAEVPWFPDADTELVIDFGKELSGYLEFEVEAPEGAVLDFYGFEFMHEGQRQDTYGLDHTLRYICAGGRRRYTSPVRRGLRYCQVTVRNAVAPVRIYYLRMLQSNYPIAEIGQFQSSDPRLNEIWQISQHTTRLCMEDTFVDCPMYEQTFWVGDARNEALINYYLFGADRIVERCLRLVPGSKFQTPLYANQVPSGWNSVIPNWTFFWVIACLELYRQNGDKSFAGDIFPHIEYTLKHYLSRLNDQGLLQIRSWNLLDWAPIDQPNDGIVSHQNMFLVKALSAAAAFATVLGNVEAEAFYSVQASRLSAAINAHLWSDERQAYLDCIHADGRPSDIFSVQTQVVALLCGIPEQADSKTSRLATIESHIRRQPSSFVQIGSPFMSFFYYEALAKLGEWEVMIEDIRNQYGQMIDWGATTCWEMYPHFSENRANPDLLTRSHCHAWSAGPAYFLGAYVLGVRSLEPGWSRVLIAPQPCGGLSWARGTVPVPGGGRIDVSWRLESPNSTGVTAGQEHTPTIPVRMHLRIVSPEAVHIEVQPPGEVEVVIEHIRVALCSDPMQETRP
ncbi:family 78 glycoside hydrolase catalytic domain [Paenibacillus rhizolycopersici]|uniref:family 78 glycoside hydrolase catalytic domain n=1 Tax=Paenibacillus rhizolycopersici TaxID=2780073 RepID=UPI003D2A7605